MAVHMQLSTHIAMEGELHLAQLCALSAGHLSGIGWGTKRGPGRTNRKGTLSLQSHSWLPIAPDLAEWGHQCCRRLTLDCPKRGLSRLQFRGSLPPQTRAESCLKWPSLV